MKTGRVKTEKYHNWNEGDHSKPIENFYKKGFHKSYDRKKFIRNQSKHHLNKEMELLNLEKVQHIYINHREF